MITRAAKACSNVGVTKEEKDLEEGRLWICMLPIRLSL